MKRRNKRKPKKASSYIVNLQKKPGYPKYLSYHWADYIELLCLANRDGEISKADLNDRFPEREKDLKEGDPEDMAELENLEKEEGLSTKRSEIPDKWETRLDDWFKIIRVRSAAYQDAYPFQLTDENELKLKKRKWNEK